MIWQEMVVEVTFTLLLRWRGTNVRLVELLRAICALMAHRRYAEAFVAAGCLPLLLALPQNPHTAGAQCSSVNRRCLGNAQRTLSQYAGKVVICSRSANIGKVIAFMYTDRTFSLWLVNSPSPHAVEHCSLMSFFRVL